MPSSGTMRNGLCSDLSWVTVEPLQNVVVGRQVASSLWMILGVAGLVLAAAIANAGSLGLSELFVRHNELVVRQSLGATPGRIARMLVLESVGQALLASIAGVALAHAAVAWLRANASAFLPRAADLAVDPLVVAICVAIAVLSGAVIAGTAMRLKNGSPTLTFTPRIASATRG